MRRKLELIWNFVVPVLLTLMIAAIIIITMRVDSEFAQQARLSRRAACSAVYDGNKATLEYLKDVYRDEPRGHDFLVGLEEAYRGNLKDCLVKANAAR